VKMYVIKIEKLNLKVEIVIKVKIMSFVFRLLECFHGVRRLVEFGKSMPCPWSGNGECSSLNLVLLMQEDMQTSNDRSLQASETASVKYADVDRLHCKATATVKRQNIGK